MLRLLASTLIVFSAAVCPSFGQQAPVPESAQEEATTAVPVTSSAAPVPAASPEIPAVVPAPATPTPAPAAAAVPTPTKPVVPARLVPGSKLYIQPMEGFEHYLSAAILKKKVPVTVVADQASADFIVSGTASLEKAGWAKTIFISPQPDARASVSIKDARTGTVVFAYNVDKSSSARGHQSTAEACAKHIKEEIERK